MAPTVRDVQTMSLPATLLEIVVFFIASYAVSRPGSALELLAVVFPFSSPYAMLARAALDEAVWPHAVAIGWQLVWVAILIKLGAALFKRRVMQSGPQRTKKRRFWQRGNGVSASANS